jgi:hypothetical protein
MTPDEDEHIHDTIHSNGSNLGIEASMDNSSCDNMASSTRSILMWMLGKSAERECSTMNERSLRFLNRRPWSNGRRFSKTAKRSI